jgi:hypothetical protein
MFNVVSNSNKKLSENFFVCIKDEIFLKLKGTLTFCGGLKATRRRRKENFY